MVNSPVNLLPPNYGVPPQRYFPAERLKTNFSVVPVEESLKPRTLGTLENQNHQSSLQLRNNINSNLKYELEFKNNLENHKETLIEKLSDNKE